MFPPSLPPSFPPFLHSTLLYFFFPRGKCTPSARSSLLMMLGLGMARPLWGGGRERGREGGKLCDRRFHEAQFLKEENIQMWLETDRQTDRK